MHPPCIQYAIQPDRLPAQMADAHELFASLRLAVHSLLRAGTMPEPAPLLPLLPGLGAQLVNGRRSAAGERCTGAGRTEAAHCALMYVSVPLFCWLG